MAGVSGVHPRGALEVIGDVHVGAALEQHAHHVGESGSGGADERCAAIGILDVDVGAAVEQQRRDVGAVPGNRRVQRRRSRRVGIGLQARGKQRLNRRGVASGRGKGQIR